MKPIFYCMEKLQVKDVRKLLDRIRQDYNRISIPQISQESGISKPQLYEYYKEENDEKTVQDKTVRSLLETFGYGLQDINGEIFFYKKDHQKDKEQGRPQESSVDTLKEDEKALQVELHRLRQENKQLRQKFGQLRLQFLSANSLTELIESLESLQDFMQDVDSSPEEEKE